MCETSLWQKLMKLWHLKQVRCEEYVPNILPKCMLLNKWEKEGRKRKKKAAIQLIKVSPDHTIGVLWARYTRDKQKYPSAEEQPCRQRCPPAKDPIFFLLLFLSLSFRILSKLSITHCQYRSSNPNPFICRKFKQESYFQKQFHIRDFKS